MEPARVLLCASQPALSAEIAALVRRLGYEAREFAPSSPGWDAAVSEYADLIILTGDDGDGRWTAPARDVSREKSSPPVVVFGPADGAKWRTAAIESGAFACLSLTAHEKEKEALLAAALRYRRMQQQLRRIYEESERISFDLLKIIGDTVEKSQLKTREAQLLESTLKEVEIRIIKAFS